MSFYALVLTEQLDDPGSNYVDLLYTAPDRQGLPEEPVWNPFGSFSRVSKDAFTINRVQTINVETVIATNAVSGTICKMEAI